MSTTYASSENITLIADPKVLKIEINENHDPFIDLINQEELVYGPSPEVPNNTDYTKLRQEVYQRLIKAQKLLPKDLHFCLYEGYRSLSLQKVLFDNRYRFVKQTQPLWDAEELFNETIKLVSPVVNLDGSDNIPPHSTGGAFDVYLLDSNSEAIDMGIHPADWIGDTNGNLSQTNSTHISNAARTNRRIMNKALSTVGFVNYPTEFWHWSYGDKYWAYMTKQPYAIYNSREEK
jgi:zinc D-Ala-D-Ala dipeptidase